MSDEAKPPNVPIYGSVEPGEQAPITQEEFDERRRWFDPVAAAFDQVPLDLRIDCLGSMIVSQCVSSPNPPATLTMIMIMCVDGLPKMMAAREAAEKATRQ